MTMVIIVLLTLILALSCYGYLCRISRSVRVEFAVGILFSCIGSLLFAAGIVNVLQEAAWLFFAGGLYCAFGELRNKDRIPLLRCPGVLYFLCISAFFFLLLFRSRFVEHDNFSHWATAVKVLAQKNGFPNFTNTNIFFQTYPLGSACFIYYITEIMGTEAEWVQMWAQAILQAGMAVSIFAFCKNKLHLLITAVGIPLLLCANTDFTDLLVDTLLPLVGVSAIAFVMFYRDQIPQKLYYLIPYSVFLVSIKSSGALFAVYALALALVCVKGNIPALRKWFVTAVCPALMMFFWKRYTQQVYLNSASTKHSISLENFQTEFAQKTGENIGMIIGRFCDTVFAFSNPAVMILLAVAALWLVSRLYGKKYAAEVGKLLVLALVAYGIYQIGTLGMYLFTMPLEESLILASYPRYHKTILIYLAALAIIAVMKSTAWEPVGITQKVVRWAAAVCAFSVIFFVMEPSVTYYRRQDLQSSSYGISRMRFDYLIHDYEVESNCSYLILVDDDSTPFDYEYLFFLSHYALAPTELAVTSYSETDWDAARGYDYILLFDETDAGYALLETHIKASKEPVIRQWPEK